jgi:hypothetical protein
VSRAGSAWRLARDVVHARYYLTANTALSTVGNNTLNLTGVSFDPINCAGSGGFVVPLAGTYAVTVCLNLSAAPAAAGAIQVTIARNGTQVSQGGAMYFPAASPVWPATICTDLIACNANDTIQSIVWISEAVNVMGTTDRTYLAAQYLGPTT